MKKCKGCGRLDSEPLGLNKEGEKYLACCPDSDYYELTPMQELIEWARTPATIIKDGKSIMDKMKELRAKEDKLITDSYIEGKTTGMRMAYREGVRFATSEQYLKNNFYQD